MEARVDASGNLGMSIPEPLLQRIKMHSPNPCIGIKHASLVSPSVRPSLGVQFKHPAMVLGFVVDFSREGGAHSPLDVCNEINASFGRVMGGGTLVDYSVVTGTLSLRLVGGEVLISEGDELLDWLAAGVVSGGTPWAVSNAPTNLPNIFVGEGEKGVGGLKRGLHITTLPEGLHVGDLNRADKGGGNTIAMGIFFPAREMEELIDMSVHDYNMFNWGDPVNKDFAKHMGVYLVTLLERPPPFKVFNPVFHVGGRGEQSCTMYWLRGLGPPGLEICLRMNVFYQAYFLPRHFGASYKSDSVILTLSAVESFRPVRFSPSTILTVLPLVNRGQSMFLPPFALCTDLLGDNFLLPRWSLACLGLLEPQGSGFDLIHNPMLRMEAVAHMQSYCYFCLLDGHGRRIPLNADSRVWLEITTSL